MDSRYSRVSEKAQTHSDNATDELLSDSGTTTDADEEAFACQVRRAPRSGLRWFLAVLVLSNLATFFGTLEYAKGRYSLDIRAQVNAAYGTKIDRSLVVRRFPAFNYTANKYTKVPSKSVDQAWEDLGIRLPYFVLPQSLGPSFSLNNSHFRLPTEVYGTAGYGVVPEMIHQLHCLNSLRMNLYYNHAYYAEQRARKGKTIAESFMISHINHCVDILRERVLCTADIGVTGFFWRNTKGDTMPDFAREHKCHDHNSVIAWYKQNAVPEEGGEIVVIPPADTVFHLPQEFTRR